MEGEVLPMPDQRRARLKKLEQVIETGWNAAVTVGQALREIRDEGLYLELGEGLTFEGYCRSRWALSKSYAYNHIYAAEVADATSSMEDAIPITTERVGRELIPLLRDGGPARVAEAWAKVSDIYRGQRPPTAREVHRVLVAGKYRPKVGHVSSGPTNTRVLLGQFGDRLVAAEKRLEWFIARDLTGRKVGQLTRKLAASYADRCEHLAHELREIAEGRTGGE